MASTPTLRHWLAACSLTLPLCTFAAPDPVQSALDWATQQHLASRAPARAEGQPW